MEAGPPELAGADAEVEVDEVDAAGAGTDFSCAGGAVDEGAGFATSGAGALVATGLLGFSSCRAAATVGRSTGLGTSSKLEALSLSETSSLSANLDAPADNESLLSVIEGGGPRDATDTGAGA